MSGWASSMPRPRARKDDVTRLAQRISRGESGKTEMPSASLKARPMRRRKTWAMFETRRWRRNWSQALLTEVCFVQVPLCLRD